MLVKSLESKGKSHDRSHDKLCPGKEMFLEAKEMDPAIHYRVAVRRARRMGVQEGVHLQESAAMESMVAGVESMAMDVEKVHLEPNFLPARFLRDGSDRARAVCRIRTGSSFGTGFLIAPGILMTNNHVIPTADVADGSIAEFDFEEGVDVRRVAINPDRIFITNESLDYTIVGCDTGPLSDVTPIRLLRDPALVLERERVSIIQHPRARMKEIALHDNRVEVLLDRVLRYRTDTEPGSSGSPVFNNNWDLVALHHAGQFTGGGKAENEGILISAIVNDILSRSRREIGSSESLAAVLNAVRGTSPFLGFFDVAGLFDEDFEIQVDTFTGDRQFADVGFWNIEHFNNGIGQPRLHAVADVFQTLSLDVFGLSEVQGGALDRLASEMLTRGFDLGFEIENAPGSQDLAVIFDRDTTQVEKLRVSHGGLNERIQGKTVFPRKPLFAKCAVTETDGRSTEFIVIVVHLKAFGDTLSQRRRRRAAEVLVEIIDQLRDEHRIPVVLGGDFNEQVTTDVLSAIKNDRDLLITTADDAAAGAPTFIGGRSSLIDHIVLSSDVHAGSIDGDDTAIVRLDRSVADFADTVSDHLPIVFRMVLGGGTGGPGTPTDRVHDDRTLDEDQIVRIPPGTTELKISFN